ncbi:MAG: HIT domain-containing protein [Mycoplasma sp.]|nr:HIT domain-containing protein [Mycoplasma sp.]
MTIFEKIINGEIPAKVIYEDENVIAFLDHMPKTTGHTLVVPKEFSRNLKDISEKSLVNVMKVAVKVAKHLIKKLEVDGFRIICNNEASSKQVVFHTHIHIIPTESNKKISHNELKF